jgi:predicted porin
MKKSLLPLALFALSGAACAQSSVTLFGVVDTSISSYKTKSSYYGLKPATAPQSVTLSQTVLASSSLVPSRIGVRGQEDLGGGWAAGFWLESPMASDSGATALEFSRRSTVSLTNSVYGELRIGNDFTPLFWADTLYDPMFNSGVGTNLIGAVNARISAVNAATGGGAIGDLSAGPVGYVHSPNSIGYLLPPNLGGFYGQLMHVFPEGVKSTLVPNSPSKRGALDGGRFGYASGPVDVSLTYQQNTYVDAVAPFINPVLDIKTKSTSLGASYNFGVARLMGELSHVVNDTTVALAPSSLTALGAFSSTTSVSYDGALLGVSVPFGVNVIRASYGYVKYNSDAATALASNLDASASKFSLGYVYLMSKRTKFYATVSYTSIKDGQNNPGIMGVPPNALGSYYITGTSSGYAPHSATGYDFGISHTF